jgi:hypothetical protein
LLLLLVREHSIRQHRYTAVIAPPGLAHQTTLDLTGFRRSYEEQRRVNITAARLAERRSPRHAGSKDLYWTLEDEVVLQEEARDVWPDWWGSTDEVGPSPFDFQPQIHGTRRILFLTGKLLHVLLC